jgi:hypothetical protein
MLAAVAARMSKPKDNVWIDLGGGTGVRPLFFLEWFPRAFFFLLFIC